jgi:type IV pilus assembly protein PilO
MTLTRKWSLLAAVLVLAIVAGGWFLLIAPKRSEAADLHRQADGVAQDNARLVQKLEMLKAQQAELPSQRALLARFRTQVPNNPALPSLIRDLTSAGRKVGVSIDAMSPQPPTPVVLAEPAAPVVAESTTPSDSTSSTGSTEPPAPVAPPAPPSLYQVPLTLDVTGSYFELEQFVSRLENLSRSYRVTGFTLAQPSSTDATAGDLTLTLQGRVFLAPTDVAPTQTTPVASATAGK